jgi:hypothetical protein
MGCCDWKEIFAIHAKKCFGAGKRHGRNNRRIKSTTHEQEVEEQMSYEGGG